MWKAWWKAPCTARGTRSCSTRSIYVHGARAHKRFASPKDAVRERGFLLPRPHPASCLASNGPHLMSSGRSGCSSPSACGEATPCKVRGVRPAAYIDVPYAYGILAACPVKISHRRSASRVHDRATPRPAMKGCCAGTLTHVTRQAAQIDRSGTCSCGIGTALI